MSKEKEEYVVDYACDIEPHPFIDKFTIQSSRLVVILLSLILLFIFLATNAFGIKDFYQSLPIVSSSVRAISQFNGLPLVVIVIPLVGATAELILGQKSGHKRDRVTIFMTFLTIVTVMFMYPKALAGDLSLAIPYVLGLGLSFNIDMLGYTVLVFTTVIWFFVMIYAHEYMKKEHRCTRFFFFMALTYSAVLGTIMAGDLLTMFLFFEVMTFTSYMLVIHGQKEDSYKAGYNYIIMGLIGGFLLLMAMLLLNHYIGNLRFDSAIALLGSLGNMKYIIMFLLVMGFGIKAGMAPVHVWLPRAHPVAPTPASALLSGVMIKVGAFGILRVATSFYFPSKTSVTDYLDPIWLTSQTVGAYIIWLGMITMAIGVFLALQQSNMKKMLAYHSVSQMGYIIMGIGIALYLGYRGAMGYAGAVYHIINHALFKSLLFMVVGMVYHHTKEYDMYKLGGLWKKLPLTATVCLIAAMGIAGIPLFNGFVSKTLLHHGIVEAFQYGHPVFRYAEWIFIVISAGTVTSFIKLFYYVFLRKTDKTYDHIKADYTCLDLGMSAMAIFIVAIGLFPHFILNQFIIPALNQTTYDPYFINKYIVGINFFNPTDLLTMLYIVILGFIIFFAGTKFHLFHLHLPKWLSIEYLLFYPAYIIIRKACIKMYGDACPIDDIEVAKLAEKDNEKVGFIDRFVILVNVFNRRYEQSIIKSDALIYMGFITLFLLFMFFSRFF